MVATAEKFKPNKSVSKPHDIIAYWGRIPHSIWHSIYEWLTVQTVSEFKVVYAFIKINLVMDQSRRPKTERKAQCCLFILAIQGGCCNLFNGFDAVETHIGLRQKSSISMRSTLFLQYHYENLDQENETLLAQTLESYLSEVIISNNFYLGKALHNKRNISVHVIFSFLSNEPSRRSCN